MSVLINEYGVIGHCEPLVIDAIDYVDLEDIEDKATIGTLTLNEPATFSANIESIDPDLWEKMLGKHSFAFAAILWAFLHRSVLIHHYRNSKRIRIRLKYRKYIIRAYKEYLRGKYDGKR